MYDSVISSIFGIYEMAVMRINPRINLIILSTSGRIMAGRRHCKRCLQVAFVITAVTFIATNLHLHSDHMDFVYNANKSVLNDNLLHWHEFQFILNNVWVCDSEPFVIFLTVTAPENDERRHAIRSTWGAVKTYRGASLRLVFLVGQQAIGTDLEGNSFQENLKKESNRYHDIVQGNFIDSYINLTYKTVFGLYWVNHHCPTSRFVYKIDDDAIVNVYRLVDFLVEMETDNGRLNRFIYCMTSRFHYADRIKSHKNYIPYSEYRYFWFPVHCHGGGYILSTDVAVSLLNATKHVPFLRNEDVYIGFCMSLLSFKIIDNFIGYFMDYKYHPLKFVELCLHKQLNWNKETLLESWDRVVQQSKHKSLKYEIWFVIIIVIIISIIIVTLWKIIKVVTNKCFQCSNWLT